MKNPTHLRYEDKFFKYDDDDRHHIFTLTVQGIRHCPECNRRFEWFPMEDSIRKLKSAKDTLKHEIFRDDSTDSTFSFYCRHCMKEFEYSIFTVWEDGYFLISCTLKQIKLVEPTV